MNTQSSSRFVASVVFTLTIFVGLSFDATAQSNQVPDAVELSVLKNIYDSLKGDNWTNKTNWPTLATWPSSATSAQFGTWFGITVTNGDITSINFNNNNPNTSNATLLLPVTIKNLTRLTTLNLINNHITGPFPEQLTSLGNITGLYLSSNNFYGPISDNLDNLPALMYLRLDANQFTGGIPGSIGSLHSLRELFLNNNPLGGEIPEIFSAMTQLRDVRLSFGQFVGGLPASLGSATLMFRLVLNNNKLTGPIPSTYSSLTALQELYLNNNELSGQLPSFIGNYTSLSLLSIGTNKFTGDFPSTIGGCTALTSMTISNNRFAGAFPSNINTTAVTTLDGSYNFFTSLPSNLLLRPGLISVNFSSNDLKTVPNFDTCSNRTNLVLKLDNNRLDFSRLETFVGKGIKTLTQTPQKTINDQSTQVLTLGSSFVLTGRPAGTGTTYTWEKLSPDGSTWTVLTNDQDGVANTYTQTTATTNDAGTYRWKTTSSIVTGVAIQSDAIIVKTSQAFVVDNWAFQYRYDGRRRMTHKKVPGAEWVYMVYDDRDRLVMTQDGEQRKKNQWTFTRFDTLNRPIITGLYTHGSTLDQTGMSALIDPKKFCESFIGTSDFFGYTNVVMPTSRFTGSFDPLMITYYDDYSFLNSDPYFVYKWTSLTGQYQFTTTPGHDAFPRVVGQVTGTWTRVLGIDKQWLRAVNYYDDKYRLIQTITDNHKRGQDIVTNVYDFTGKVLATRTESIDHHMVWGDAHPNALKMEDRLKNLSTNSFSPYATSAQTIPAGTGPNTGGWVEFTCSSVMTSPTTRTFGFSTTSSALNIGWAVKQDIANGASTVRVYENNVAKGTAAIPAQGGDVIRIERRGTSMLYSKNGVVFYTTTLTSTPALYAQVYLSQTNAELFNPKFSLAGSTKSTERHFDYDHAGRLLKTWHKADNGDQVLLVKNEYNELGQLIDKKLHSTDDVNYRQSLDYRYNIRGWLTSINGAQLTADNDKNPETSHERRDLFGMDLSYNVAVPGLGNSSLFNGNISAMRWSNNLGLGDTKERAYTFGYDPMNRLNNATQKVYASAWGASSAFHESGVTYDLNGNIITLNRTDKSGAQMDALSYKYGVDNTVASNMLRKVDDTSNASNGFADGMNVDDDYAYDNNGNLTIDKNKSITSITYNHLNLPDKVTKSTGDYLTYTYDATGRKLAQDVYNPSNLLTKRSDYRGEWFYENDTLRFLNHEEGRAVVIGDWIPAPQMLPYPDMSATTSYTGIGTSVSLTTQTIGSETYLKVVNTVEQRFPGFQSGSIPIVPGRKYTFRFKGYNTSSSPAVLYVSGSGTSSGDVLYPGPVIASGSGSEGWVEATFTVPSYINYIKVGAVLQNTVAVGATIYVNRMELYEYNPQHGNTVFSQTGYEYQYHLKDHLGNVRMTFTTKDEVDSATATMETANAASEQGEFKYYSEAVIVNSPIFDHTDAGTTYYSTRLNGRPNERYGLAKSFSVMPGDTINTSVFAKYVDPDTQLDPDFAQFLASIHNNSAAAGVFKDGGLTGSIGGMALPLWALFTTEPENNNPAPKAYLNWLVFDRDYNLKDGGAIQITTAAAEHGLNGDHEELSKRLVISEAGYVYVYLTNDNFEMNQGEVEVYFDDFRVEHVKSPVIQSQDFYPFGLAFNGYSRENSLTNQYKFQGQEHQDELDLGWDSFKWRNNMPEIGRFFNIDPLADKYVYNSPYAFSENKVVAHVELEGLESADAGKALVKEEIRKLEGAWNSLVEKIGDIADNIKLPRQVGKTDIEKKNSTPIATEDDQKEQIRPTSTSSDMDGNLNPLYNPNATVEDQSDDKGEQVMTSSQSHQKSANSTSNEGITIDSITIGQIIRVNYQFGSSQSRDSTRDIFDRVKVGDDTATIYRLSVDDKNKQVLHKNPKPTLKN
jgi:RHS repeat-associated protein